MQAVPPHLPSSTVISSSSETNLHVHLFSARLQTFKRSSTSRLSLSLSLHFDLIRLCGTQLKTNEHKKTKSLRYTAELIRWTPISIRSASVFRFLWNNPSLIFLTSTLLCTKQLGTRVKLLIQAINRKGKCWYWNTAGENEAIGLDACSCCCWK